MSAIGYAVQAGPKAWICPPSSECDYPYGVVDKYQQCDTLNLTERDDEKWCVTLNCSTGVNVCVHYLEYCYDGETGPLGCVSLIRTPSLFQDIFIVTSLFCAFGFGLVGVILSYRSLFRASRNPATPVDHSTESYIEMTNGE